MVVALAILLVNVNVIGTGVIVAEVCPPPPVRLYNQVCVLHTADKCGLLSLF